MLEARKFQEDMGRRAAEERARIAAENLKKEKESAKHPESEVDRKLRMVAEDKMREESLRALEKDLMKHYKSKKEEMN